MTRVNAEAAPAQTPKREKRDVHGWVVLDKPVGMSSTHAVSVVKRLFQAKRAGHAGTLDPLASGVLPIALGEATKTGAGLVGYIARGVNAIGFPVDHEIAVALAIPVMAVLVALALKRVRRKIGSEPA